MERGRVTCATGDGDARARFTPRGIGTQLFRLAIAAPTLVPRTAGDLTVVLAYDGTRQMGALPASAFRH